MARLRTATGESLPALQMRTYVVAATRAAEMSADRGGFGGQAGAARPKWRFLILRHFASQQYRPKTAGLDTRHLTIRGKISLIYKQIV
jgi:hypothetical protein